MKYVVVLADGMADYPLAQLGGQTPLQVAKTPHMDLIAQNGVLGQVKTTIESLPPGSDVANLSVLGYDPQIYYSGRAPLEAASLGVKLQKSDVAYRCNLVTIEGDTLKDYSAGHIPSAEAKELIEAISAQLETEFPELEFYPGVSYRHLMVHKGGEEIISLNDPMNRELKLKCTPPHDIQGKPYADYLPVGKGADFIRDLIRISMEILGDHPINRLRVKSGKEPANSIWLWGCGQAPQLPTYQQKYKLKGAVISAVDLIKGLGLYAGLEIINVPGATGYLDTNYLGKGEHGLKALEKFDFVFIHVEAADEAGHEGNLEAKISAIEAIDEKVLGTILDGLEAFEAYRIMILPDHPTPISVRTHVYGEVPFAACGSGLSHNGFESYSEPMASITDFRFEIGHKLMDWFLISN